MTSFTYWIDWRKLTGPGKILFVIIAIPVGVALVSGIFVLFGHIIKWLWNATIATIFETNPITFWQAVMIFVLCKLLFGAEYNVALTTKERKTGPCDESEEGVSNADGAEAESWE